jgi:predicted dehydrogenase
VTALICEFLVRLGLDVGAAGRPRADLVSGPGSVEPWDGPHPVIANRGRSGHRAHEIEEIPDDQVRDFLASAIEARPPPVTGEDGRAVVAMFAAIYRSARERRPVVL